jgi:hypothetical protein
VVVVVGEVVGGVLVVGEPTVVVGRPGRGCRATVVLGEDTLVDVVDVDVAVGTVVVGRDGGGGSDGTGTSGRSGNASCEQSIGSPVSPSTKLQ